MQEAFARMAPAVVESDVRAPALAEALQDQIMVDPTLGGQANGDSVRPPGRPYASPMPATAAAP